MLTQSAQQTHTHTPSKHERMVLIQQVLFGVSLAQKSSLVEDEEHISLALNRFVSLRNICRITSNVYIGHIGHAHENRHLKQINAFGLVALTHFVAYLYLIRRCFSIQLFCIRMVCFCFCVSTTKLLKSVQRLLLLLLLLLGC